MRALLTIFITVLLVCFSGSSAAMLSMELTRGISSAMPIAISPFVLEGAAPSQDIASILSNDLKNSGRFNIASGSPDEKVVGKVSAVGGGRYHVSFQLIETARARSTVLLDKQYTVPDSAMRALAHHISDAIYQKLMGVRGIFSTRLAYIVVEGVGHAARYTLEVSDQDGYNPQPLLQSSDPIMSPAWSPDGRKIAYVSFERHHASIYIEEVATGSRHLVSEFIGINSAPAWSPDGRKLAIVLSKTGSPNIYMMDLGSRQLTPLTRESSINTEPSWSPNGRKLLFTSNRGGAPQIYELDLATKAVSRLTYQGHYNARASYTADGRHIAMLNQDSGFFNIGILDLDTGVFRILTSSSGSDNESPSIAPNGSMVLFGTLYNGHSVLGMVATDGSVQVRLPARNGEVQDPAWSPFLS